MRKFFLIGILVVVLIAVPLTVYILTTQKTTTQSGAAPSTVLSFDVPTDPAVVGTPVAIPVTVDPTGGGSTGNQVSFIKLVINYDGSKLQATSNYFVPDPKFSTVLEGPSNSCNGSTCTISATVSTGADPNNAVGSQNTVATLNFNPLTATAANTPTQLTFAGGNQVLSIASTDKPAENVLNRSQPGALTIVAGDNTTGSTGGTDNGTTGGTGSGGTTGGTTSDNTTSDTTAGTGSATLTCDSLTADNTTGDSAPFTTLLTATGGNPGSVVNKVSFNFGDGAVQDVTSGGGIGTDTISVQTSHIYKTAGTFTATTVFTDDQGNTTTPSDCSETITVGAAIAAANDTPTPTEIAQAPVTPTIPATGPGNVIVGVGIIGVAIAIVGFALLAI